MITAEACPLTYMQDKCIPVRMADDTMEPWLNCNDWVFVDPADKRLIDSLAAFEFPDELEPRIYRVQLIGGGKVLMACDNPRYSNQTISVERARLMMVGRVCGVLKKT